MSALSTARTTGRAQRTIAHPPRDRSRRWPRHATAAVSVGLPDRCQACDPASPQKSASASASCVRSAGSQESLADAAARHRTHISLIERGQRSVRLETIERLALALRIQPAELMPPIDLARESSEKTGLRNSPKATLGAAFDLRDAVLVAAIADVPTGRASGLKKCLQSRHIR
jgi:transcriptional regulator with XRE-family HTH domain